MPTLRKDKTRTAGKFRWKRQFSEWIRARYAMKLIATADRRYAQRGPAAPNTIPPAGNGQAFDS